MIPVAIGYDFREAVTYHVLEQSIMDRTTEPVCIIPLSNRLLNGFDGQRDGTNSFIYSRFLVPSLMDYQGWAIYLDSDMLLRDDLAKLWALRDPTNAVQVVQHDYQTKHRRKLVGTPMEARNDDYPRKNWSSMVLWNCAHLQNRLLTPSFVSSAPGSFLHRFQWLQDSEIGAIDSTWNHLVGEQPMTAEAKLVHFTAGAPCFSHYRKCEYSTEWHGTHEDVNHALDKSKLMGVA